MNDIAVKKENKQLAQIEVTPMQMIQTAMEKGVDAETLGKMMDLQERHESNQAKKAFVNAMNSFKSNNLVITKDKDVSYKQTSYSHASLANIIKIISGQLSDNGLSFNWITKQDNGLITVLCKVTHIEGHSEQTSMSAGSDQSGGKNAIQAVGSTTSYLQRYTLCSILGLAASDDDDGAASEIKFISPEKAAELQDLLDDSNKFDKSRKASFLSYLRTHHNATCLTKLSVNSYDEVLHQMTREK